MSIITRICNSFASRTLSRAQRSAAIYAADQSGNSDGPNSSAYVSYRSRKNSFQRWRIGKHCCIVLFATCDQLYCYLTFSFVRQAVNCSGLQMQQDDSQAFIAMSNIIDELTDDPVDTYWLTLKFIDMRNDYSLYLNTLVRITSNNQQIS